MGNISNFLTILPSLWLSFPFSILLFATNFSLLIAENSSNNSNNSIIAPPPQNPQPVFKSKGSQFRPSIAVIVGVLTTVFSVTFLLLLYAKHCRRGSSSNHFRGYPPTIARKDSGIDRGVIESLPVFRFASLRGQKEGLECAVCLNKFEPTEVLRLLPKCKHAFHVECVDTWLDAHSTCPLCRYRVDPEDILLVEDNSILYGDTPSRSSASHHHHPSTPDLSSVSRVSGRHSFAGANNPLEVIVETPKSDATSFVPRRSLDSWNSRKKRNSEMVAVGCFDRPRKDELLLADRTITGKDVIAEQRRLEHRIIVSGGLDIEMDSGPGPNHRWSDVHPSDLLFLQSEMILSDNRRFSTSRGSSTSRENIRTNNNGRNVINGRSVSEITGMSRFRSNEANDEEQRQRVKQRQEENRKRQEGAVSRWWAWISQSQSPNQRQPQPPAVVQHGTTIPSSSIVV